MNLPTNKFTPWLMWGLGALFFAYEFMLQVSPSIMVKDLMRSFSVNAAQLGNLSAFYLYAYAIMQIPVGILLDRFGARRLLTLAALLCASGAFFFSTAHSFLIASLGRAFIGFGSAFAVVSGMYLTATWLPVNRFALMVGVMLTIGFIGAITGQAPLSLLVNHIGWRSTLLLFSVLGLLLAISIWLIVRDRPRISVSHSHYPFWSGFLKTIKNRQLWIVSLYAGLMYLPTPAFTGLWGVPFLITSYHLTSTTAAFIISMTYVGYALGCPFFGWFSDRINLRKPPMVIGSIGALIALLFILMAHQLSLTLLGLALGGFGFFSSGFLAAFSVAREISPSATQATALGFVNALNSLGGALAQPFIGFLLDWHWAGNIHQGVRQFSAGDFKWALMTLPLCIALSLLLLPLIKETHCKTNNE